MLESEHQGVQQSSNLLKCLDNWTLGLDNGNYADVIFMDFQKACSTVPHKRLISKLDSFNIRMEIINWIEAFIRLKTKDGCKWKRIKMVHINF